MSRFVLIMHLAHNPLRAYGSLPVHSHIRTVTIEAEDFADAVQKARIGEDCERLEIFPITEEV